MMDSFLFVRATYFAPYALEEKGSGLIRWFALSKESREQIFFFEVPSPTPRPLPSCIKILPHCFFCLVSKPISTLLLTLPSLHRLKTT